MTSFLIALPVALILIGLGTIPGVLETWRIRSELNYERFAQAYAEAAAKRHEARQSGERA
jgi:hypothetical protein